MRKIFGPKTDGVTGEWRKVHKEEHCTYFPSDDLRVIESTRRRRWPEYVARMRRGEVHALFCWGNPRERATWKT